MAIAKEILIVDDEVGIRELLSEILQDEGYRVALAENAGEARAYRQRQQPALVLLDIWMPDTDGVTLLREWQANGQLTMPVVMMSGHGTIETAVDATKVGAYDFLEKPVGLQKLLSTIARALKSAAAQEPRRVSLAALGSGAAIRETERSLDQLIAGRRPILLLGEPGTGHDLAARALQIARRAVDRTSQRRPTRRQPARPPRGGPRGRALLRGDRAVLEGGAARSRVPRTQARQVERDARVHQQRAARQPGRRRQVRRQPPRVAGGGHRDPAAAAHPARGHSAAHRTLLAPEHEARMPPPRC